MKVGVAVVVAVVSNADGHLCWSYARIGCCHTAPGRSLPWGCTTDDGWALWVLHWTLNGHASMLGCLGGTGEGRWFHQEAVSQGPQRTQWT